MHNPVDFVLSLAGAWLVGFALWNILPEKAKLAGMGRFSWSVLIGFTFLFNCFVSLRLMKGRRGK
jgi:hypothetical protein